MRTQAVLFGLVVAASAFCAVPGLARADVVSRTVITFDDTSEDNIRLLVNNRPVARACNDEVCTFTALMSTTANVTDSLYFFLREPRAESGEDGSAEPGQVSDFVRFSITERSNALRIRFESDPLVTNISGISAYASTTEPLNLVTLPPIEGATTLLINPNTGNTTGTGARYNALLLDNDSYLVVRTESDIPAPVPEATTLLVLAVGLLGLAAVRRQ